ncbi:MAG: hypothetical protein ACLR6B_18200 [Blautia sp.]
MKKLSGKRQKKEGRNRRKKREADPQTVHLPHRRFAAERTEYGTAGRFRDAGTSSGRDRKPLSDGNVVFPYNREIFILFQMDGQSSKEERRKLLEHWLRLLRNNISQYLTGAVVIGISQEFEELPETRKEYQHAVLAAEQYFFHPEQNVFFYKRPSVSNALGIFETKDFLEEQWLERFSRELEQWLELSGEQQLSVTVVKNIFLQNMRQMMHYILSGYHFEERFREKWRQDTELIAFISSAASSVELKDRAVEYMKGFQAAAFRAGVQNPLIEVLNYIDRHLDGKLTLPELAQLSCMSVPSFCKNSKSRRG